MTNYLTKKIIMFILIGSLVVAVEAIALWWLGGRIKFTAQEAVANKERLAVFEKERLEFASLQANYSRVRQFIPQLTASLPTSEQLFGILNELNRLAVTTGNQMTLATEGFAPQSSGISGVLMVPFTAQVGGNYTSLRSFLRELGVMPYFVRVESVSISSQDSILGDSRINLSGRIYLR